jgi:hypothetical protein
MFAAVDKTKLQPGEAAPRQRAGHKNSAPNNSGDPRTTVGKSKSQDE